jgi:hypothetical protein
MFAFNLFQIDENGIPIWCGEATDMEHACELIPQHAGHERTRFLVWSYGTGVKTFFDATTDEVLCLGDNAKGMEHVNGELTISCAEPGTLVGAKLPLQ